MDDLAEKINAVLNDPAQLQQVMHLASSLGLGQSAAPEFPAENEADTPAEERRSTRQAALVRALMPYLRPGRRERLQRAIQVAQLSNLGNLLAQSGLMAQQKEEDGHV